MLKHSEHVNSVHREAIRSSYWTVVLADDLILDVFLINGLDVPNNY